MNRSYPVLNPTRALNTGSNLTTHLLTNYSIPAKAWHQLWFDTKKQELQHPSDNVFRGNPADSYIVSLLSDLVGCFKDLSLTSIPDQVNVNDLSAKGLEVLNLPLFARPNDIVLDNHYASFDSLDDCRAESLRATNRAIPLAIHTYFIEKDKVNYSERDVLNSFLDVCFTHLKSPQMNHIRFQNNILQEELARSFHMADACSNLTSILNYAYFEPREIEPLFPMLFYALISLGKDPMDYYQRSHFKPKNMDKLISYLPK